MEMWSYSYGKELARTITDSGRILCALVNSFLSFRPFMRT
jgi:hypothetical protein